LTRPFRAIGSRTFSLRRAAAILCAAVLVNTLVAPVASACRSDDAPGGSVAVASEHDRMHGNHVVAPPVAQAGSTTIDEPISCAGHDADCVSMAGCSATTFVVADASESAGGARSSVMSLPAAGLRDHTAATDHPPPRV
jgi:hypothetical protein